MQRHGEQRRLDHGARPGVDWPAAKGRGRKAPEVDEERPRREARQHFWAEFRAAVEQIVGDFNAAVGQSLVELSPGQTNVSSLGVRAGSTACAPPSTRIPSSGSSNPVAPACHASECSASCMSTAGSTSPTCLPAQMLSPASSSSRGSSRLCEDGNVRPELVKDCRPAGSRFGREPLLRARREA